MSDDIGQSVRDRLAATAEVKRIVASRIHADVLAKGEPMPAIVVFVPGNTPHEDLGGSNRVHQSTITVLAYGETRKEANALAKAIRDNALAADLRGRVEGMEWQEVSLIDGPVELNEAPQDASDKWRRLTSQTFVIWNSPV